MPKPREGETKDEYIPRCIAYMIKKEGKEKKQAAAICYSMWERKDENDKIIKKIDSFLVEAVDSEKWWKIMNELGVLQSHLEVLKSNLSSKSKYYRSIKNAIKKLHKKVYAELEKKKEAGRI